MESVYGAPIYIWLYDLSINMQTFADDTAADFICQAVARMTGRPDEAVLRERLICMALAARVDSAIKKEIQISPYRGFEVTATPDAQINLDGAVHDKYSKTLAEKIAMTVKGVSSVVNRLETTDIGFS